MKTYSTAWAIKHWSGGIYVDTVCRTRREAIATFKKTYRVSDHRWKVDARGSVKVHRAIKVKVEPL